MANKLPIYLTDHPSLVGIIRFPLCTYNENSIDIPVVRHDTEGHYDTVIQPVNVADNITCANRTSGTFSISKSKVTDFYPYTYYVLTDGEAEPLIMYPQYLPSSFNIIGQFALSHQPIERYYPSSYKGSSDGSIYNITNQSQMMLPTATNNGMSYLTANSNSILQNRRNQQVSNVLNAVMGVTGVATAKTPTEKASSLTYGVANFVSGLSEIKSIDARNKDSLLTPSTISSYGTVSTRDKFNNNRVRIVKYTVRDVVKNKIENFCNRYGNKYNNYATIDLKSYKGYVKFVEPDIDSKIDNIYIDKIIEILEKGVFIE